MSEVKVVYRDEEIVRILRGTIEKEDEFFITIKRKDGIFRINKSCILRIEEGNNE